MSSQFKSKKKLKIKKSKFLYKKKNNKSKKLNKKFMKALRK